MFQLGNLVKRKILNVVFCNCKDSYLSPCNWWGSSLSCTAAVCDYCQCWNCSTCKQKVRQHSITKRKWMIITLKILFGILRFYRQTLRKLWWWSFIKWPRKLDSLKSFDICLSFKKLLVILNKCLFT